jgi:hypothetical protein
MPWKGLIALIEPHYPRVTVVALAAGLLTFAGVLGIREGRLLHRKTRRVALGIFAKSGSLLQSFLIDFKGF